MNISLFLRDLLDQGNSHGRGKEQVRSRRYLLCYLLHISLVAIQLILAVLACYHPEHRIIVSSASEALIIGLNGGLQTFYTLYTTLLVFVTQQLMLSSVLSGPTKLTQIHDLCGAWYGLSAALSTLWQQTKVKSSVFSIALVTAYFLCVSVLHVASSSMMGFQLFNQSVTSTVPAISSWPDPSVELVDLDWRDMITLPPFLQNLYGNTTQGLADNTLYDVPLSPYLNATVNATTLDAHCGLLTNMSIDFSSGDFGNITVSMAGLPEPLTGFMTMLPLPNEIWVFALEGTMQPFIIYLVSSAIDVDESVGNSGSIYVNGTFSPPNGTAQNFTTPIYLVACSFSTTAHTAALTTSGIHLESGEQPAHDSTWTAFSPSGNDNLGLGIVGAIGQYSFLPRSGYCQPIITGNTTQWVNLTAFQSYMATTLGIGLTSCNSSIEQYTATSYFPSKDAMERFMSKLAAQFIWLAGQLGETGGGFSRGTEQALIIQSVLKWRLNINILPVASSLGASVILCVLVVCMRWGQNSQQRVTPTAGVLEIMWLGSRSRVLREHLGGIRNPSIDRLCAISTFEAVLVTPTVHACGESSLGDRYVVVPSCDSDVLSHSGNYKPLGTFRVEDAEDPSGDLKTTGSKHHLITDVLRLRRWCYLLHLALVIVHILLLALLAHHPEHTITIPYESNVMTAGGLGALLQATYTLYSALLVLVLHRLASFRIASEQEKLTTVHDVSSAWTGIGAAIFVLWRQHKLASSPREVLAIVTYLGSMLALHIVSSSVLQWQTFNTISPVGVIQTELALPNSTLDISNLGWSQISFVATSTAQDSPLLTYGLSNNTIYDIPQISSNLALSEATVNATALNVQCGLAHNLTLLSDQLEFSDVDEIDEYQISLSVNRTSTSNFLVPPMWKDQFHRIDIQCLECPQTLFYMITTAIDVDSSVHDLVSVELPWTYMPSGGTPQNSTTLAYIAACSISTHTGPATVNLQDRQLVSPPDQGTTSTSTSWLTWSPIPATNIGVGMTTALSAENLTFIDGWEDASQTLLTNMDMYMMSLLGLNSTLITEVAGTQSSAGPSVMLTPAQLENAIAQTAARFLWVAGQLGEDNEGFDRIVGESPTMQDVLQWRLNVNAVPVIFASIASFTALAVSMFTMGSRPNLEHPASVSGTSVLELLWLEANSEELHSHLQEIGEPESERLREVGMFDIRLGDVTAEPSGAVVDDSETIAMNEELEDKSGNRRQ